MRLLIVGASGRTGKRLVERALDHGHEVTVLVRDARAFSAERERLVVVRGDVLEPDTLSAIAEGQDAVVSVLAPRPRTSGRVYVDGTRNLADAVARAGTRRLIVVSAEGAGVDPRRLTFAYRLVRRIPVVARLYPDIARMEADLRSRDDVEWTVVRPAILTNRPPRGDYRTVVGEVVPGGQSVSREDLAAFLLDVAENRLFVRESVAIAY